MGLCAGVGADHGFMCGHLRYPLAGGTPAEGTREGQPRLGGLDQYTGLKGLGRACDLLGIEQANTVV